MKRIVQGMYFEPQSAQRKTLAGLSVSSVFSVAKLKLFLIGLASAGVLAGCGEYKQSVAYEDGGYQGKKDERMWDNERFMHDPSVWKQMINERTQRQNEYGRTGDQG